MRSIRRPIIMGFMWICLFFICPDIMKVSAEGSAQLISNGGYRPYLEYHSDGSTTAGVKRQTIVNVYLKKGEKLLLGSSVYNSQLDENDVKKSAATNSDIVIEKPDGTKISVDIIYNSTGHIVNTAMESAGPKLSDTDPDGFDAYVFTAAETGIYKLNFHSQTGVISNPACKGVTETWSQSASTVAAWDATVVGTDGDVRNGRIFTKCLALNIGANGKSMNSSVYVVTTDGYIYKTDFNGMCPYGFVFFANNRGLVSTRNNYSLYQSFVSNNNQLSDLEVQGATYHDPWNTDTLTDKTFSIFFNQPDPELEGVLYPTAFEPETARNLSFIGSAGDNKTHVGYGGYFTFDISNASSATITVDLSHVLTDDGSYKNYGILKLSNPVTPGKNYFYWDGKSEDGITIPVGNYDNSSIKVTVETHSGEYHFPLFDVEMAANGIKVVRINSIYRQTADSNGIISNKDVSNEFEEGKSMIYYNNKSRLAYLTSYKNPSKTIADNLDCTQGTDSTNGAMKFGMSGSNYNGDQTALDIWTYSNNGIPVTTVLQTPIIINDDKYTVVSGKVFYDIDKNKVFSLSAGDYMLDNIEVKLSYTYTDEDGNSHSETEVAYTDSTGIYHFFGIPVMENGNLTQCTVEIIRPLMSYILTTSGVSTNSDATLGTEKQTIMLGGKDKDGNILYTTEVKMSDAGYFYERTDKSITVKKDWVTDISSDPLRPVSVDIKIRSYYIQDEVKYQLMVYSYTLSNSNRWTFTDTSLPAYLDDQQTVSLYYELLSETYTMRSDAGKTYYYDAQVNDENYPYSTKFVTSDSIDSTVLTVINEPKKGTMQIIKRDAQDKSILLEGVEFVLWEETGLGEIPPGEEQDYKEHNGKIFRTLQASQTNSNGVIVFTGLDQNSYFFIETKAATGYAADSTMYDFTVSGDSLHQNTSVYNQKLSVSAVKSVFIRPDNYDPTGITGMTLEDAYRISSVDNYGTDEKSYDKRKAVLAGDRLIYIVHISAKGYTDVNVTDTVPEGCSFSGTAQMKVYRQQVDSSSDTVKYLDVTQVTDAKVKEEDRDLEWSLSIEEGYEYYAVFEVYADSMKASQKLLKIVNKASVMFNNQINADETTIETNTVVTDMIHLYFQINKTIPEADPSQVFLFKIERFSSEDSKIPESVFYTDLHSDSDKMSKLIEVDRRGYYKITELAGWSQTNYDQGNVSFIDITGKYTGNIPGMYTVIEKSVVAQQPRSMTGSSSLPTSLGINDFPLVSFTNTLSKYAYLHGEAYAENKLVK